MNKVFATHSDFPIPISLQPNLRYFKIWIVQDQIDIKTKFLYNLMFKSIWAVLISRYID